MKTFVVLTLSVLFVYLAILPGCQHLALQRASNALQQGETDKAWTILKPRLHDRPMFFGDRAKALCGQVTLQQARNLAAEPRFDFGGAVRLLTDLTERCQGYEEKGVEPLLEELATSHLARATKTCGEQDFSAALQAFQEIDTLAYPEKFRAEAKNEAAWCRLDYAKVLTEKELFEEALGELNRVLESGNTAARKVALGQILPLVEEEISFWLDRVQYVKAFETFNQRRHSFENEPEITVFFSRLESQLQLRVFGVVLTQQCRDTPTKPQRKKSVAVGPVDFQPSGGLTEANLRVANSTTVGLRVLLRSSAEQSDLQVKAKEKKQLSLEPAAYVVGVFAPGNCLVKPTQAVWKIDPLTRLNVEIVSQN